MGAEHTSASDFTSEGQGTTSQPGTTGEQGCPAQAGRTGLLAGTGQVTIPTGPASVPGPLLPGQGRGPPLLSLFFLTNSHLDDTAQLRCVLVLCTRTTDLSAVNAQLAGTALSALSIPASSGTNG